MIPKKTNSEENLLLALCQLTFRDEQIVGLAKLSEKINNWDYFTNLATIHGVSALVYTNLETTGLLMNIPSKNAELLKKALLKSMSRNIFLTDALTDVLHLLNQQNIKTVLLKGMALEKTIYGNMGVRQMNDIDILIRREQCIEARNLLMKNGFVSLPVKSPIYNLMLTRIGKHLPSLIRNGASVEIHHDLFTSGAHSLTAILFNESTETNIKGEKTFIPPPQLFFLYLVKHLKNHELNNESQLRLYTDLAALIEKYCDEIINYDLLSYASKADLKEALADYLYLLRVFWNIQFPGWLEEFIAKKHRPDTSEKFIIFLRNPRNEPSDKRKIYRKVVKEIPGIHRKILFVVGDIFPSLSFMKKRYRCAGKIKAMLYYPHRIGKLWWLIKN
jgi:hypothetical protein